MVVHIASVILSARLSVQSAMVLLDEAQADENEDEELVVDVDEPPMDEEEAAEDPAEGEGEENAELDEEEEDALAFLSPVSFDPFVTYRTFSDSGVSLAREVMVAVEQAEKYAAAIERDLMGIDGGHVDDSEEDDESAEEEGGDDGAGASGEEEKAHLPVASALFGLINASGLSW